MSSAAYGRGRLTDDDHARIYDLAGRGKKPCQIARLIRRHQSTVQWFMYSQGLVAPRPGPDKQISFLRNGRLVHRFTPHEDAYITALRIQGFRHERIADLATKRFDTARSAHTIKCRLIMLAAREEVE